MSQALAPAFHTEVPPGDERERRVCDHCGFIDYVNPRIVVGSVVTWADDAEAEPRILMCRRAIEPRRGFWTLPAGFMETGEAIEAAAAREAREEACCEIEIDAALFGWDEIPWGEIAFPSVVWALNHWRESRRLPTFPPFRNPA